ncbi:MAG: transketolase [Planctomycetota bacterium]|jgi:transketolase
MRNAFIAELTEVAEDPRIMALLADNGIIVYDNYLKQRPNQLLNLGIAESNLIGVAAGLASCGFIPVVYSIIPFLVMRPFEFVRDDICYQNLNVKLIGIGAGFAYSTLGPTHHGTEDVSLLACLPNLTILSPCDPRETRKAARAACEHDGPVYLRIGTGRNPEVYEADYNYQIGKGVELRAGTDVTLISTGTILSEVMLAADQLEAQKISTQVINMHTLKPLDRELVLRAAKATGAVLTIEEHSTTGGLASLVASVLMESDESATRFACLGLKDRFCESYGPIEDLRKSLGLTSRDICTAAVQLLSKKRSSSVDSLLSV